MQAGGNLKLRQHYEGQLSKYTNVVKGWQFRWFVLNPDYGLLEYHMSEVEMKMGGNKARGSLHLDGAVILPSEEDSHTFVVQPANGESYKLRAVDAKERQEWITRLRVVAEIYSSSISPKVNSIGGSGGSSGIGERGDMLPMPSLDNCNISVLESFEHVQKWLQRAQNSYNEIANIVDNLPLSGEGAKSTDIDLLTLKATSQASLNCLQACHYSLQIQQRVRGTSASSEWDEI